MTEQQRKIVNATISVFCRYGVRRATMNDIAVEVGIVRQTLYNVYAGKGEVLRAAVRWNADRQLARLMLELQTLPDLEDHLDAVFKYLAVQPFEQSRATPHAQDIVEGVNAAAAAKVSETNARSCTVFERIFTPYRQNLATFGETPSGGEPAGPRLPGSSARQ